MCPYFRIQKEPQQEKTATRAVISLSLFAVALQTPTRRAELRAPLQVLSIGTFLVAIRLEMASGATLVHVAYRPSAASSLAEPHEMNSYAAFTSSREPPASSSIPHLSFATDLLFNVDDVRANCTQGLATQSQLVTMLKSRVALERQYASELARMAQQSQLDELEQGTAREALGRLKAQYLNTSVQHKTLATSLEEDVLRPIEALHSYNSQKAHNLIKQVHKIKKQAKAYEDVYKKDYSAFEKQFREASMTFAAAMDAGFSSTLIEHQYHCQLMQLQTEEDPQQSMDGKDPTAAGAIAMKAKSAVAIQATFNHSSQKLVNWLLASDQQRKDNLCSSTANALEATELARRKCQKSWRAVEQSRIDMYRSLQSVLTEYQQMAEYRISNLATNLRKHVVFQSSALANEQYDWQMIAGQIESVDFESDLREFILMHQSQDLPSMTVGDLCSNPVVTSMLLSPTSKPSRPLKKVPLEIVDLAVRKIPFDYEGNQESLARVLVTRNTTADIVKVHPAVGGHPNSPATLETVRLDQLKIDCGSPPAAKNEQPQHGPSLRVALAQDVALAIAQASDLRVAVMHQPHPSKLLSVPVASSEPENNGGDSNKCSKEFRPPSHANTTATSQSNDVDDADDDATLSPMPTREEDDYVV